MKTPQTVDLHVHSTKSDGSFTPAELVSHALEIGLSAFALSDHDTVDGIDEAMEAAKGTGLEVIPAIEFSTEYEGKDIHILGLYIDHKGQAFQKYLQNFRDSRDLRNRKMCQKLTDYGVPVSYEALTARFPGSVLTRAHYAKFLLEEGYVKSMTEAFERYVGDHAPCFLPREKVTPSQAVKLILEAGGIPVLAHPILYHMSDARLDKLVAELKDAGLVGIEAIYSTYSNADERQIRRLAKKYDLLITGGSDFHGTTKPNLELGIGYGKLFIPYDILFDLKTYLREKGCYHNRIIFSDMDGTLLDDKKQLSPQIYDKIIDFTRKGGHFVLSSGRPLPSILETAEKLGLMLPGTYIISFNGALVYDCGQNKSLRELRVPMDYVKKVLKLAEDMELHAQTYTDTAIVSPKDDEEVAYYRQHIHMPVVVNEDPISAMEKEPFKLLMICLEGKEKLEEFRHALLPLVGDLLHTFYSSPFYLECCVKEASKGSAIRFLCDYLNIPIANSIAAGDEANDISMLEAAGIGVCMINGNENTKAAADYITKDDNNRGGFLEVFTLL